MRTSDTDPIRVDWLPVPWPGRVGLTFAPGKKQPAALSGSWYRDLGADLSRLRDTYDVRHLVCLLEDHELRELQIADLRHEAAAHGIILHRLPITDGSTPIDDDAVRAMVRLIVDAATNGEHVVVHCKGGLGRAGTIGGCVLVAAGMDGESALRELANCRPGAPETKEQGDYIRAFKP